MGQGGGGGVLETDLRSLCPGPGVGGGTVGWARRGGGQEGGGLR